MSTTTQSNNPFAQSGNDSQRLRVARASDEAETYRVLAKAVRRVCPPWLRAEVDELIQKASLKIVEAQAKRGESLDLCSSYLHRVAFSVVVDEVRNRKRRDQTMSAGTQEDPAQSATDRNSPTPESALVAGTHRQAIVDCMNRLNEKRRMALTLRLQGHDNLETAKILHMTQKQIGNLVHRGRLALRECLQKKGVHHV